MVSGTYLVDEFILSLMMVVWSILKIQSCFRELEGKTMVYSLENFLPRLWGESQFLAFL